MKKEKEFKIRAYAKSALAHMYFPEISVQSATSKLRRKIGKDPDLIDELLKLGGWNKDHYYTANEVATIVDYLGVP